MLWSFSAFRVKFQALSWTAKPEILKQLATGALRGIGTCKDMWGNLGIDRDGYICIRDTKGDVGVREVEIRSYDMVMSASLLYVLS